MSGTRRLALACLMSALALVAAGCGDDDDTTADAPAGDEGTGTTVTGETGDDGDDPGEGEGGEAGSSTVSIELVDYGYVVSGPLASGAQTFETTNTGEEIHMVAIGRLRDGVTIDQVGTALSGLGGPGGGGEPEGGGGGTDADEQGGGTDADEQGGGTDADEQGGDPFEELFEEELGTPGHILFPGESQRITLAEGLDAGTYALICFLPTEGDGTPHFVNGMINSLEVVDDEGDGEVPEADASYSLTDDGEPDGPASLPSGDVVIELTNDGDLGKDVAIGRLDEGQPFEAFDEYFTAEFESGGPPAPGAAGRAPGRIAAMTFELAPGQTIYLGTELDDGEWLLVSTTNPEDEEGQGTDHVLPIQVG